MGRMHDPAVPGFTGANTSLSPDSSFSGERGRKFVLVHQQGPQHYFKFTNPQVAPCQ